MRGTADRVARTKVLETARPTEKARGSVNGYEKELAAATRAARRAAALIREHAGHVEEREIRHKALNDLVTEADEAAQRIIIRTLQETFPDAAFLAEEGDVHDDVADEGRLWLIDPIDGTTNFTRGVPPFAVSIGLRDGDEMVAGVILDVSQDDLFTAVRGHGTYVNGKRCTVSTTDRLKDSLITTGFPYREIDYVDVYLEVLGDFMRHSRGLRRPGSAAVDLAYVAAGRFDGFFEAGLQAWDIAAGALIVEEAGGRVTNFSDEEDPLFDEQVLATNLRIHGEMLELVARLEHVPQRTS